MPQRKSLRFFFLLFGMLYFVQGVITSYQLNFFKPHMTAEGINADRLAIVASLALLPFIIKILFGVISDRINLFGKGHRVPYMIVGVALCSLAFFIAYFIDPSLNFTVLAAMVLVSVGGFSLSFMGSVNYILMLALVLGIIAGLQWTVYASLAMGITDLRIAGSMFALFQMMANIGMASGEGIATSLSNNALGFTGVFRMLATINIFLIPFFLLVMRQVNKQIEKDKIEPHTAVELVPESAD